MVREDYEALANARQRQKTAEFKQQYSLRSGIEGTISQGVRGFELRQSRYIGLAKTRLQHKLIGKKVLLWVFLSLDSRAAQLARCFQSLPCLPCKWIVTP